jgi:putative effector of murein hydrolase LrgA (UPF0299 family)
MTRNESNTDRIIRIVLALVIFALGLATGSWLALIGIVPLATGLIGWCPLYSLFGLSTCPVRS